MRFTTRQSWLSQTPQPNLLSCAFPATPCSAQLCTSAVGCIWRCAGSAASWLQLRLYVDCLQQGLAEAGDRLQGEALEGTAAAAAPAGRQPQGVFVFSNTKVAEAGRLTSCLQQLQHLVSRIQAVSPTPVHTAVLPASISRATSNQHASFERNPGFDSTVLPCRHRRPP